MTPRHLLIPLLLCSTAFSAAQTASPHAPSAPPTSAPNTQPQLPKPEQHIRQGIITLNKLYQILLKIDNKQLADSAALDILKIQQELIEWGQGFGSLKELSAEQRHRYEQSYLPIIEQINNQIRAQSARLHSARYYDSTDLPTVLVQFVNRVK